MFIFQSTPSFQMARVGSHRRWTKSQGPTSGLRQRGLQQITTPGQSDDKTAKKLTFPSTSFILTSIFRGISVFEHLQPRVSSHFRLEIDFRRLRMVSTEISNRKLFVVDDDDDIVEKLVQHFC